MEIAINNKCQLISSLKRPSFKGLLLVFLILFSEICGLPKDIYAATINAGSTSYADVSAAIIVASGGDTVIVPAGQETWDRTLTMTRGLTLKGAGIDSTTITNSGNMIIIEYVPDSRAISNNEKFEVEGFTFDHGNASGNGADFIRVNSSSCTQKLTNMIIANNKFRNQRSSYGAIKLVGAITGLAYSNQFVDVMTLFSNYGCDNVSWNTFGNSRAYGTGDPFYFEDNLISFTSSYPSGDAGIMYLAGQGALGGVVRYNTWDKTNTNGGGQWDYHGSQYNPDAQQWSGMVCEAYGNIFINSSSYEWLQQRGSWMLMFNNRVSGTNPLLHVFQYSCLEATNAPNSYYYIHNSNWEQGWDTRIQNSYYWNNWGANGLLNAYVNTAEGYDYCHYANASGNYATWGFQDYLITDGRDLFNYNSNCTATSCTTGTTGVGTGAAAPMGTCTAGAGYWKTSYTPASTPPATMADMKTYTQSGTFYQCTTHNTWTAHYAPYTYPHPLRAQADVTPLAAPSGLAVN